MAVRSVRARAAAILVGFGWIMGQTAFATPPAILSTPGFGAPESGEPDDLVVLPGDGLKASDRVVYQAVGDAAAGRPRRVPDGGGAALGTAPIVQAGDPPSYLTIKLPNSLAAATVYRLWVVNAANEWSPAVVINKPHPLWITPSFVYASGDVGDLGRRIRIVGRNLLPSFDHSTSLRLTGPATYTLETTAPEGGNVTSLARYVVEAALPKKLAPGAYKVGFSRDGRTWTDVPDQLLDVRSDPQWPDLPLDSPSFGSCHPNDAVMYGDECLRRAIHSAQQMGGANIVLAPGTWNFSGNAQFPLPPHVNLSGAGADATRIVRQDWKPGAPPGAMFVLTGHNSITGIGFSETHHYDAPVPRSSILQLGGAAAAPGTADSSQTVSDIIISGNAFARVGRAITDGSHPISRLVVTHNLFGAYQVALGLPGSRFNVSEPYRIDDSVIRSNRFVPGSYTDISAHQGTMASELGAGYRVDFSANVADGASTEALQSLTDPKGWRAAFFWDMNNSQQMILVAQNRISCAGDKVGDGEAISFDGNGGTFAFNDAPPVIAANADTITVRGALLATQNGRQIDRKSYYNGQWIQVVEGTGIGQVRQVRQYREDPGSGTVEFRVEPAWDIPPLKARVVVGRVYHQVYALANEIEQRQPACTKANLTGPRGGAIAMWGPSAGSVIEGNRQFDSGGITFQQIYTVATPSCPRCGNYSVIQIGLEIRGNLIDGEYDWSSDCSWSGIFGSFGASATPESLPPVLGFAITIARNEIRHADGLGGGAIDLAPTWTRGPPPYEWPLIQGLAIYRNALADIQGPAPRSACRAGQRTRVGIRLAGSQSVSHATLSANRCTAVPLPLEDSGRSTAKICADGMECTCNAAPD